MKKSTLFFFLFSFFMIFITPLNAKAIEKTSSIPVSSYELKANDDYSIGNGKNVSEMSYGNSSVGVLKITGDILEETTYSDIKAYGVSGNVSFRYDYDDTLIKASGKNWHIIDDKIKKVNGKKFDSNILSGALLIQKSNDGKKYENAVNPVLDFFHSNTSGTELYTTSGEDISQGIYIRIILAYRTEKDNKNAHWYILGDSTFSKRHMEVYNFYIVEDSGVISIHNLTNSEEILHEDDYTQELMKHGETLVDNSITRDGFSIEKITSSYNVSVSKNYEKSFLVEDGDVFTEDGKYEIVVETKLGKQYKTTVYVFKGGTNKGYFTYFGDGLIQAERIFREGDYPTYARGGQISIKAINDNVPLLNGTLTNIEKDEVVFELSSSRSNQSYSLEPGKYKADFYNGDPERAGSIYHYTFVFEVLDEESSPYVNFHNLMQTDRLEDLQTKHYEVAYQTTSGGYIYVCFSLDSYDEALRYAREIEGRFVEESSDGGYYYKDKENPNRKVKYHDEIELTRVREEYALKNVEYNYFNPIDAFSFQTYDDNLLNCLEKITLTESIKVFPNEEEKIKLLDRVPYINNFTFIQATEYDVVSVEAKCENNGEIYNINFGEPVDEQLSVSSLYHITETNKYGKKNEYNTYYVSECQTTMKWNISNNGTDSIKPVSYLNDKEEIEADSAYVSEISNDMDKWAIVTVKAPDVYSFEIKCLASEFSNLEFIKGGVYDITFIDRLGNSYSIKLKIKGIVQQQEKKPFTLTYTHFYNNIFLNAQNTDEDIFELSQIKNEESTLSFDEFNTEGTGSETITTNLNINEESASKSNKKFFIIFTILIAALIPIIIIYRSKYVKTSISNGETEEASMKGENNEN